MAVSASALVQAMKHLSLEWEQTKVHWHDVKSRSFEEKFLQDLTGHVAQASSAIDEINTLLGKVRHDCE